MRLIMAMVLLALSCGRPGTGGTGGGIGGSTGANGQICEPIACSCNGAQNCVMGCMQGGCPNGEQCSLGSHPRCVAQACTSSPCPQSFDCVSGACARKSCSLDGDCDADGG